MKFELSLTNNHIYGIDPKSKLLKSFESLGFKVERKGLIAEIKGNPIVEIGTIEELVNIEREIGDDLVIHNYLRNDYPSEKVVGLEIYNDYRE